MATGTEYKITGSVKSGANLLGNATVQAKNTTLGITRNVSTDKNGEFVIERLRPGQWALSAKCSEHHNSNLLAIEVREDWSDICFELEKQKSHPRISGRAIWESGEPGDGPRIGGALVKASRINAVENIADYKDDIRSAVTDENGNFILQFGEKDAGDWDIHVVHENAYPATGRGIKIETAQTKQNKRLFSKNGEPISEPFLLTKYQGGTHNKKKGWSLFWWLIFVLASAIASYILLHNNERIRQSNGAVPFLSNLIEAKYYQGTKPDQAFKKYVVDTNKSLTLAKKELESLIDSIDEVAGLPSTTSPESHQKLLRNVFKKISPKEYFWTASPWRYLEIIYWGLFGILIHLLVTIARYVRNRRYFEEGLIFHIAHLITVPVVGLITVLLISKLEFKIGSSMSIDLSDIVLLVITSFIICIKPWNAWDFLVNKNEKLLEEKEK